MNRATLILVVANLVAFGVVAYGLWGPYYATTPLRAPFSFSVSEPQEFTFRVGRSETYFVEVHLKAVLSDDSMDQILGDFPSGGGGAIDVSWSIADGGTVVASGSNKQYGFSPILSEGRSGVVLGTFDARRGADYKLRLTSHAGDSMWDRCEPLVEVGLHPSQLEYLLGNILLGAALLLLLGPALVSLMAVRAYRWACSRMTQNMEIRHLTSG